MLPVHRVMFRRGSFGAIGAVLVAFVFVASSCTGGAAEATFRPTLTWDTCPSDIEIQYFSHHQCGWLTVLQDRSEPDGKVLRLLVVETWPVGEAPVPGFNAAFDGDIGNSRGYGSAAAGATRTHHRSFALELRGTGHSEPSLSCPEVDALDAREARALTGDDGLLRDFLTAVGACRDRLTAEGVVPADYDINNTVLDMEDLRIAVESTGGISSPATGPAPAIGSSTSREFPDRVGGVWMDSPQFPQVDEVSAGIDGTRYALDRLFEACSADARCAYGVPRASGPVGPRPRPARAATASRVGNRLTPGSFSEQPGSPSGGTVQRT